jgi:hypothetical protein
MSEDTEIFYKQIKNKIAKLDRRNLVKRLILTIRTIERIDSIPDRKFHLWNLYFLLKMAVKFGIFAPSKLINDNDLIHLHNLCTRLNNFVPPEIEQQGHATSTKIVRIISYQQFWLQKRLNFQDIGRTIKLVELSEFDPVTSFNTVLNISTKEFIKYTFILFAWINSHQDFETIDLNDISFVTKDKEAFESVINYLTRDVSDLAKELNENRPIRSLEIFEQSTLFRYPICKIDNSFYLISVRLLEKSITQLIGKTIHHFINFKD